MSVLSLSKGGDDLQCAATVRAVVDVDVEDPFEQPDLTMRAGAPCACAFEGSVACSAGLGMISLRNFAFGASTPWKRIRCKRGRGTTAARRYMNSSGQTVPDRMLPRPRLFREALDRC